MIQGITTFLLGTAFTISSGTLLTAQHVVDHGTYYTPVEDTIVEYVGNIGKPLPHSCDKLEAGDTVTVVGYGWKGTVRDLKVSSGEVTAVGTHNIYHTTLEVEGGMSGSPVFNDEGKVVGVLTHSDGGSGIYKGLQEISVCK